MIDLYVRHHADSLPEAGAALPGVRDRRWLYRSLLGTLARDDGPDAGAGGIA